ncbi:MAG: hypothetical protein LUE23_08040 [Lachnospiraceae bacterium]|nr:hypothetical protein [Lachnospiraceae bacterium]
MYGISEIYPIGECLSQVILILPGKADLSKIRLDHFEIHSQRRKMEGGREKHFEHLKLHILNIYQREEKTIQTSSEGFCLIFEVNDVSYRKHKKRKEEADDAKEADLTAELVIKKNLEDGEGNILLERSEIPISMHIRRRMDE